MDKNKYIGLICFVCLLFPLNGCKQNKHDRHFPVESLCVGDIVFRRGTGLASRAVLTVDKMGAYSHVGIVVKYSGEWQIVHAVPGESDLADSPDKVKMEPVGIFFGVDRAVAGAVMRPDAGSLVKENAARRAVRLYLANTLFDHDYDKEDTIKMYCSELVQFVYCRSGLNLVEDKCSEINMPGFSGFYLLPSDIQSSKHLRLVDGF